MTKEETKAKELIEKFYQLMAIAIAGARTIQLPMARKAAIFHVEAIINIVDVNGIKSNDVKNVYDYWQSVLTHLKNT